VGEVHLCGVAAAIKKEYTPKVDIWRGSVGWSPDGKMVAFRGAEEAVHLWELATGKEIRRFSGHQGETTAVAWSPDGQSLASAGQDRTIRLWEASTGKQVRVCVVQGDEKKEEIPFWVSWVHAVAWSPDGKMLASAGSDRTVRIWWVATGREICRCTGHTDKVKAVAWSPDGRTLASGGADRSIRLWETATGKELLRYAGHQDVVNVLSWSPDGKLLASGSQDTTLLVWKDDANDPARLTPAELEACWAALAGDDAAKSHHARCALARDGANAAPFLARRLKPVAAPDPEHVARLIENLDSDEFSTRQKSSDELALLGELAEPALRRAFGKNPSAESRKHLEELLSQLGGWSAEQLRALRAITALERMATREARALLVELSSGAPASRLTHEARASLERLSRAQK
jgi:WD40 repeat protein